MKFENIQDIASLNYNCHHANNLMALLTEETLESLRDYEFELSQLKEKHQYESKKRLINARNDLINKNKFDSLKLGIYAVLFKLDKILTNNRDISNFYKYYAEPLRSLGIVFEQCDDENFYGIRTRIFEEYDKIQEIDIFDTECGYYRFQVDQYFRGQFDRTSSIEIRKEKLEDKNFISKVLNLFDTIDNNIAKEKAAEELKLKNEQEDSERKLYERLKEKYQ